MLGCEKMSWWWLTLILIILTINECFIIIGFILLNMDGPSRVDNYFVSSNDIVLGVYEYGGYHDVVCWDVVILFGGFERLLFH